MIPASRSRRAALLTLCAAVAACGLLAAAPQPRPSRSGMRAVPAADRLYASATSALEAPAQRVIRTRAEWIEAWAGLGGAEPSAPPPAVNFARYMVLLVALGERSSGGHEVRVDGVRAGPGGSLTVHVTRTAPGPGCMTTQALTSPVEAVRVPRAAGAVRFVARDVQTPC